MPDDTRLKAGDCIVIDIGGRKQRYCSDMTRTYSASQADRSTPPSMIWCAGPTKPPRRW